MGMLGIDFGLVLFMSMDISGQYSFYDYRIFGQGFRLFLFNSSLCPLTWLGGYTHNCFVINDRIYGSVFYIGIGLHGSHSECGVLCFVYYTAAEFLTLNQ
ncbi:unnamed protein product, partial [Brugia timori]